MYADDYESTIVIAAIPFTKIGKRPQTIDAGVLPKVHEDDSPLEPRRGQLRAVEPAIAAFETGNAIGWLRPVADAERAEPDEDQERSKPRKASPAILHHQVTLFGVLSVRSLSAR